MKYIVLVCCMFMGSVAQASASATLDVVSDYYWRGLVVPGVSLQPGLSLDLSDSVSVSAWGAFNLDDRSNLRNADEVDLTFTYSASTESVVAEVGLNQYVFPNNPQVSVVTETFVALGLSGLPVTPSVTNYLTVSGDTWWYFDTALSAGLGDVMTDFGELAVEAHFAVDVRGEAAVKPSDAWGSLAFTTEMANWIVTPSLNYGYTLSDRKVVANGGEEHTFWVGLGVE